MITLLRIITIHDILFFLSNEAVQAYNEYILPFVSSIAVA